MADFTSVNRQRHQVPAHSFYSEERAKSLETVHSREGLLKYIKASLQPLYTEHRISKLDFAHVSKATLLFCMQQQYGGPAWTRAGILDRIRAELSKIGIQNWEGPAKDIALWHRGLQASRSLSPTNQRSLQLQKHDHTSTAATPGMETSPRRAAVAVDRGTGLVVPATRRVQQEGPSTGSGGPGPDYLGAHHHSPPPRHQNGAVDTGSNKYMPTMDSTGLEGGRLAASNVPGGGGGISGFTTLGDHRKATTDLRNAIHKKLHGDGESMVEISTTTRGGVESGANAAAAGGGQHSMDAFYLTKSTQSAVNKTIRGRNSSKSPTPGTPRRHMGSSTSPAPRAPHFTSARVPPIQVQQPVYNKPTSNNAYSQPPEKASIVAATKLREASPSAGSNLSAGSHQAEVGAMVIHFEQRNSLSSEEASLRQYILGEEVQAMVGLMTSNQSYQIIQDYLGRLRHLEDITRPPPRPPAGTPPAEALHPMQPGNSSTQVPAATMQLALTAPPEALSDPTPQLPPDVPTGSGRSASPPGSSRGSKRVKIMKSETEIVKKAMEPQSAATRFYNDTVKRHNDDIAHLMEQVNYKQALLKQLKGGSGAGDGKSASGSTASPIASARANAENKAASFLASNSTTSTQQNNTTPRRRITAGGGNAYEMPPSVAAASSAYGDNSSVGSARRGRNGTPQRSTSGSRMPKLSRSPAPGTTTPSRTHQGTPGRKVHKHHQPTRIEVVEFLRTMLQPAYNDGRLQQHVFTEVVRTVSAEFFAKNWSTGSLEADEEWQGFLRNRIVELVDL